ncbi:MAG TPA: hypothetical protein PK908_05000 [Bacteroidales bacterium]|nr:hypothetical protein [Bacteroidales bacterium]
MNDVVMFHIGRCGSTLLSNILGQHSLIESRGEIFIPFMKQKAKGETVPTIDDILLNQKGIKQKNIQLFELKFLAEQHLSLYNLEIEEFIETCFNYGYNRFIVLERKNYLRRMISHCVSQESNIFHVNQNQEIKLTKIELNLSNIKVGIKSHSLIDWLKIISDSYEKIRLTLSNYDFCDIVYEDDLLKDASIGYNKVCNYLNITPESINITTKRINPFRLQDILINYKEVDNYLHNTIFEWMLYEN